LDSIYELEQISDLEKLNHEIKMAELNNELDRLKSVKRPWLNKFMDPADGDSKVRHVYSDRF